MVNVRNIDVVALNSRLELFKTNIQRSGSGSTTNVAAAEIGRWEAYMKDARSKVETANKPPMDLPKLHPMVLGTPTVNRLAQVTNPYVNDMIVWLETFQVELIEGQSNDQPSGWHPADYTRFIAILDRIIAFIDKEVKPNIPLDLPDIDEQPVPLGSIPA